MNTTPERYDALVIGSGVGGLSAAARLAHHGYRVLLVESRDRVGGRASSVTEEGFTVNVGGIAVEYGGVLEETFREVGAPWDIRVPKPATLYRLGGKNRDLSKGGLGKLVNGVTKKGAGLLGDMGKAGKNEFEHEQLTLEQWIARYTKNDTIHAIFRNMAAAIFAVNASEVSAKAFLTYLTQKGAFRAFGFSPNGTGGLMQGLADAVEQGGGTVWTDTKVTALQVDGNRVTGATVVRPGGETVQVGAGVVVSNVGPHATVALAGREHFDDEYLALLERDVLPTANIVFNFASQEELIDAPGLITFGVSRSICNMANLTATCPELAPEGWNLYVCYGVPTPAVGAFDEAAAIEAARQDLRDEFPGFDERVKMLSIRVMQGEFPAQRTIAGRDVPQETPLVNLLNVGDAVREYADGGMQACAKTGKTAAELAITLHDGATA